MEEEEEEEEDGVCLEAAESTRGLTGKRSRWKRSMWERRVRV